MSSRLIYSRPIPVARVVNAIADKAQVNTQTYGRRPYGVGLLIAGVDETGPHLWEFQPSGMVLEYKGAAIGARSQSARTYLERNFEKFADVSVDELVVHGLRALRDSLAQDKSLNSSNTSVAVVGIGEEFTLYVTILYLSMFLCVELILFFRIDMMVMLSQCGWKKLVMWVAPGALGHKRRVKHLGRGLQQQLRLLILWTPLIKKSGQLWECLEDDKIEMNCSHQ